MGALYVNVGCGQTPTQGYQNFDNSPSLRLANLPPFLVALLRRARIVGSSQAAYIEFCRSNGISFADATRRIPLANGSSDVVYSSHMLEHLDADQAIRFFSEARRVLKPGGVLRIAVPDLRRRIERYRSDEDADAFVESLLLHRTRPTSVRQACLALVAGDRGHAWMYDGSSLVCLITRNGFEEAEVMPAGTSRMATSGALDLRERHDESVYVEAVRPS